MKKVQLKQNPAVKTKFKSYPPAIRTKLKKLRDLILAAASEDERVEEVEETLKWGEPSYLAKKGSTIRITWSEKNPEQYGMYFQCTSKLVPTFRTVYGDFFKYEKNRALLFNLTEELPEAELKQCISLALNYHTLKKFPLLGM